MESVWPHKRTAKNIYVARNYNQVQLIQGLLLPSASDSFTFGPFHFCFFIQSPVCVSIIPSLCLSLSSCVVDNLQSGGFFNDKVTKSCVFSTVHDAVLYCQSSRPEIADKVTYSASTRACTQRTTSSQSV